MSPGGYIALACMVLCHPQQCRAGKDVLVLASHGLPVTHPMFEPLLVQDRFILILVTKSV